MKVKFIVILIVMVGLLFLIPFNSIRAESTEEIANIGAQNLKKYEMVFVYPEHNREEVMAMQEKLKDIYVSEPNNLIITEKVYNTNDCNYSILANLELQGDIRYKNIIFVYTDTNLCEHIKIALQNTSSTCKHKEGFTRSKICTIPTEESVAINLEEWKQGREDWYNYEYAENTDEAIDIVYESLNIIRGIDSTDNVNDIVDIQDNSNDNQSGDNTENREVREVICENDDIRIKFDIEKTKLILANGTTFSPEMVRANDKLDIMYMDKELIHGSTVYIQYVIKLEKKNDTNITNIKLEYDLNKSQYDEYCTLLTDTYQDKLNLEEGWLRGNEISSLKIEDIQLDDATKELRIVTSQVITAMEDLSFQNIVKNIKYTKFIINEDETISEAEGEIEFDLKSKKLQIIEQ